MDNFNALVSGGFEPEDLVNDGWTDIIGKLLIVARRDGRRVRPGERRLHDRAGDFEKMEQIRARVDTIVADPTTAEALKPYYRQFCKRPCFHDEYLDTFNRDNVTLVDTHGRGVERMTERGSSSTAWNTSSTASCTQRGSRSAPRMHTGYYNNEGRPGERAVRNGSYGAGRWLSSSCWKTGAPQTPLPVWS